MTPTIRRTFGANVFGAVAAPQSLGIPAAAYPGRIATNSDLIVAVDRQQTTLLLPLNASATSMTVFDPSMIVAYSLLSIDNEIVKTTGVPAGNVISIVRGFDGTAPSAHLAGALVSGLIDAYHHNALVSEIEAIETALGPNLSAIPVSPLIVANAYQFTPQTPGGNLVVGANSVTLSPVPRGVNGTDRFHYLYVSGGTGTPEAVLITGGTAVSGAASGTVIVNCAGTHSGAWTISSASGGIKEASCVQNEVGTVTMLAGTLNLYGPLILPTTMSLKGAGVFATFLKVQGTGADPAIVIVNYDKTEGTGFFGEHRDYQLWGPESGRGFWIGGNVLGISNTWQGDQVRVTNCYFNRFNQTLVIQGGNFCVFEKCMFAPLSTGLGTAIYIPAGGGSLQPLEFYGCVITGQNIAVQMDNANFGAAYLLYMGGQVSGVLTGNELCWESHGTHYEPNVHGQLIVNVTTSSVIKIFGGLLSVHLDTLMAAAINVTGANSTFTIEGTYVIVDGGQIVTNFVNFGGGAGGKFRMQGINVAPAGGFTNMYAFPGGVPNICSIDLGIVSVTVTAAATLVFPQGSTTARSVVTIQGATIGGSGITAVSGLILGQYGIITTLQPQTFTAGASIGNTITLTPNVPYTYYFSGTQIWIR
jgi:hypothetical protein